LGSIKFEAALSRLETLVNSLEKGDLSLEQSLKVFEEGVRLSQNCERLLNEAEKKVEMLIHDKEGKPQTRPYPSNDRTGLPEGVPEMSEQETSSTRNMPLTGRVGQVTDVMTTYESALEPEDDSEETF